MPARSGTIGVNLFIMYATANASIAAGAPAAGAAAAAVAGGVRPTAHLPLLPPCSRAADMNRLARWSIMGRKDYNEALITVGLRRSRARRGGFVCGGRGRVLGGERVQRRRGALSQLPTAAHAAKSLHSINT